MIKIYAIIRGVALQHLHHINRFPENTLKLTVILLNHLLLNTEAYFTAVKVGIVTFTLKGSFRISLPSFHSKFPLS